MLAGSRRSSPSETKGVDRSAPVAATDRCSSILHSNIRVILPTGQGLKSAIITDLMLLASLWIVEGGTQPYDARI